MTARAACGAHARTPQPGGQQNIITPPQWQTRAPAPLTLRVVVEVVYEAGAVGHAGAAVHAVVGVALQGAQIDFSYSGSGMQADQPALRRAAVNYKATHTHTRAVHAISLRAVPAACPPAPAHASQQCPASAASE